MCMSHQHTQAELNFSSNLKRESVGGEQGPRSSLEFRIFFQEKGNVISPWHDIPLWNEDGTVNFICEIPKESSAKMEVATVSPFSPTFLKLPLLSPGLRGFSPLGSLRINADLRWTGHCKSS